MSVSTIDYKEDDKPVFADTLVLDGQTVDLGSNGNKVDEVRFYMERYSDGGLIVNDASGVTITDGPNGEVEYAFGGDEFESNTYYRAEWRVNFKDGRIRRYPPAGYIAIESDNALGTLNAATITESDLTVAQLSVTDSFSLGNDTATSFADITNATELTTQEDGTDLTQSTELLNFQSGLTATEPITNEIAVELDESSLSNIPNSALTNDSVTYTAGNALSGGGTVALGGSTTLDVDETAINISNLAGVLVDATIKTAGDDLTWATDGNDDLQLQNSSDATTLLTIDQDTGDITFEQLSGSPTISGHDHTAGVGATVPNAGLTNDSVTYTAGNALTGGGSVALGGSATLDVDESGLSGIPNSGLTNDSVTVSAGNALTGGGSVALGGSTTLDVDETAISGDQIDGGGGNPVDIGARDLEADTTTLWNESNGSLTADINTTFANINELFMPDDSTDPAVNGAFRVNGNDVKVYSGGAVRNFSNIGSSGGAPTDASYLTTASESGLSNETVVDAYPFTATDLATGSVTGSEIAASAVDTSELAADAVTSTEVLDGTLTSSDWDTESFQDEVGAMAGTGINYDDPNGQLEVTSTGFTQVTATNDYTASVADDVWVDTSVNSVNITITAPPPTDSERFFVDAVNTSGGTITLEDNNGESIIIGNQDYGGANTPYQFDEGEVIGFASDGATWRGGR